MLEDCHNVSGKLEGIRVGGKSIHTRYFTRTQTHQQNDRMNTLSHATGLYGYEL